MSNSTSTIERAVRKCATANCGRGGKLTRGMCSRCYRYWIDHTPKDQRPVAPRFSRTFWDFVQKGHERDCWVWTGATIKKGYGAWSGEGIRSLAHRHSWSIVNGPIPDGMWVLHHCDNPPCVNPNHLYLGTVIENVQDMIARNRNHVPARKEYCKNGHLKRGPNLRVVGKKKQVICRTCDNKRSRERQQLIRQAMLLVESPPASRISTTHAIERFGIPRSTFFNWRRLGYLSEPIQYRRNAYWITEEISRCFTARGRLVKGVS